MTTINVTRKNVMQSAWQLVKQAGFTLSEALKKSWAKFTKKIKNLTELSNDELRNLIVDALKESFQRGGDVGLQAVQISRRFETEFDEKERKEAERKVAQAKLDEELKKQKEEAERIWKKKAALAKDLEALFGTDDITINVWLSGGEKRVYLNTTTKSRKDWKGKEIACLFVTGSSKVKPMTLGLESTFSKDYGFDNVQEKKEQLEAILLRASNQWNSLKLDIASAL